MNPEDFSSEAVNPSQPLGSAPVIRIGSQTVDLTNCDREPIHVPGYIQPHGLLLVLDGSTLNDPVSLRVVQASANAGNFLGLELTEILGRPATQVLGEHLMAALLAGLKSEHLEHNPLHLYSGPLSSAEPSRFDMIVHRQGQLLLLEFEPSELQGSGTLDFYPMIKSSLGALGRARTLTEFTAVAVREIRKLTGHDRVMIYRFAEDGTGSVVAEDCLESLPPFLGLHYPASDIPKQARALYLLNMLRIVIDVNYVPVPIEPVITPSTGKPLDLSYSVLRSVSPIHVQYLQNMGVGSTFSVSILRGGELWGLIACHHQTPKRLGYDVRAACEFLGQVMSLQLTAREEQEEQAYRARLSAAQVQLVEVMARQDDLVESLLQADLNLLGFIDAPGAAVCIGNETVLLGLTPDREQVLALAEWLSQQGEAEVLHTDTLSQHHAPAQDYVRLASGLLAVRISRQQRDYVMWFRPEQLQTVSWGGDPNKPVEIGEAGESRLTPRKSFEAWQEMVQARSVPWKPLELAAAHELRSAILEVVLRQAEALNRLNIDLSRSNAELDAFAYIASHDLKEPLRGLHNYATFLMESYSDRVDEDGQHKLRTLVRLTQRMEDLIDSLLLFSRVGRVDLSFEEGELGTVLGGVLEVMQPRLDQDSVQVQIPRPLPRIKFDRVRVGEVFNNLISNAVKYNDKAERFIEVGYLTPQERGDLPVPEGVSSTSLIFYVRDNGIGIREKHLENIFRIFKRLHARDQYGGGTGSGLTIARKIVERHGGHLWVNSTLGEGSTFLFTLQGPA